MTSSAISYQLSAIGCQVLGTRYSVLGTRYWLSAIGYRLSAIGCQVLGTPYSVLGTRYSVLGTSYYPPTNTHLARYNRKYATNGVTSIIPNGGMTFRSGRISQSVRPYTTRIGLE